MKKQPLFLAALIFTVMFSVALWNSTHPDNNNNIFLADQSQTTNRTQLSSLSDETADALPADKLREDAGNPPTSSAATADSSANTSDNADTPVNRTSPSNDKGASTEASPSLPSPVSRSAGSSGDLNKYPLISVKKGIYGQFHYRELGGGRIEIDPKWVAENIVTVKLPGVNRNVQVHRLARDKFIQAFTTIANSTVTVNGRKMSLLSQVKTFDGTWVTRHVNWNANNGLSNHSWGIAVDINAASHFRYVNPGTEPNDPNLILWQKAFQPAGFKWGNSYSDSMHYELY